MPTPTLPPCTALGPQCRELPVQLRVASLSGEKTAADHEATLLLGHTERISFGSLGPEGKDLLVDAVLHLRCRHLKPGAARGEAHCAALGHSGPMPPPTQGGLQPRLLGRGRFRVVAGQQVTDLELQPPPRSLPVVEDPLDGINPCSIAPCETADHRQGSACCRDLQIEIMCSRENHTLEALVRSRLSPYLCKVSRDCDEALEAEMISACGYLEEDGRNCSLHGRLRPDGRPAKPDLCSEWPDDGKGLHPGCIFYTPPVRRARVRQ